MRQKPRRFVPKRRWLYPMGCEREYQRFAKRLIDALRESVKEALPQLQHVGTVKQDSVKDNIAVVMETMRRRFRSKAEQLRIEAEIKRIASITNDFNQRQFRAVLRSALQVDIYQYEPWLQELTELWTAENARLITSVPETVFSGIEGIAARGVMEGTSTDDLADDILDQVDMSERRAQLIARDQVGKLNGDITKYRQETIGIEEYRWSTSKDSRVRPAHAAREGLIFRWDRPPVDGHPGKAIYCRCVALPVIDLDKIHYIDLGMPTRR